MMWHTWLAYLGLICGLLAPVLFKISLGRSAAIGFAAGLVLVTIVNVVTPRAAPCLESSKGWDILRAYRVNCLYKPVTGTPAR
jgi:hypothetical protein